MHAGEVIIDILYSLLWVLIYWMQSNIWKLYLYKIVFDLFSWSFLFFEQLFLYNYKHAIIKLPSCELLKGFYHTQVIVKP